MSSDFLAHDPGAVPAASTPAAVPGAAPATPSADNAVVLEYGGRQFTKADLLTKLAHADQHISTLTKERESDRAALGEAAASLQEAVQVKELLAQLRGQTAAPAPVPPLTPAPQPAAVTPESVAQLVQSQLAEADAAARAKANFNECAQALAKVYGDRTNTKVAEVAQAHGMTVEAAGKLAQTNPKLFLLMFPDLTPQVSGRTIPGSTINPLATGGNPPKATGYLKANDTRAMVDIYQKRLRELGA